MPERNAGNGRCRPWRNADLRADARKPNPVTGGSNHRPRLRRNLNAQRK